MCVSPRTVRQTLLLFPPQETVLDFYGVPIKAADIRAHVDRMSTLSRRIGSLPDPHTQLQLPPTALPPLPKWSRAVSWSPHDDAMLLLGAYLYGLGSWEQCATRPARSSFKTLNP